MFRLLCAALRSSEINFIVELGLWPDDLCSVSMMFLFYLLFLNVKLLWTACVTQKTRKTGIRYHPVSEHAKLTFCYRLGRTIFRNIITVQLYNTIINWFVLSIYSRILYYIEYPLPHQCPYSDRTVWLHVFPTVQRGSNNTKCNSI